MPTRARKAILASADYLDAARALESAYPQIAELIAPQGRFALIDDPKTLDVVPFKRKSVSTHWEFMFTRSMFETADMETQGQILSAIASLVDAGDVRTTLTERFSPINAANLKRAHQALESTTARGKIVIEGWQ